MCQCQRFEQLVSVRVTYHSSPFSLRDIRDSFHFDDGYGFDILFRIFDVFLHFSTCTVWNFARLKISYKCRKIDSRVE